VTDPGTQDTIARAQLALDAGDIDGAWCELHVLAGALDRDPDVAAVWLDLLRMTPGRPELLAEARRILVRWPEEPPLVTRACDALIRVAERVPRDEPQPEDGPAQLAASAAARCLAAIEARGGDRELVGYLAVSRANALRLTHAHDEALAAFEAALAAEPQRGWWWFNLGLLHKARHAWSEGLAANQRARSLLGDERAVLWNIALCAVALAEGDVALESLRALGLDARLANGGMPYVDGLPPVQVRAATIGGGLVEHAVPERSVGFELLWVTPISPCHGVVSSASYREASIDYGDVVLWDGVPLGVVEHEGKPVARFPLLARLRPGDEHRFRFVALQQGPGQVADLARDLPEPALLFIHREQIEMLCARCANGERMRKHKHGPPEEHRLVLGKMVLPNSTNLRAFQHELEACLRRHTGVQWVMPGLSEALGETAAAGKAHQMWNSLVRRGL
jgi:tetratricopeptide (TPR) repeat protein